MKRLIFAALIIAGALMMNFNSFSAEAGTRNDKGKIKMVNVGDAKIAYRIYGEQRGTPILLLSPLGSSLDDWDPAIIKGLAKNSQVVVFDNKGVGGSSGKTPTSIPEMAQDAISFIKALNYQKVNLLGFSMGGFIAQQIVETEPQLVDKIILAGTGPQGAEGLSEIGNKISSLGQISPEDQFLLLFAPTATSRQLGKESFARIQSKKEDRDLPVSKESFVAQLTAVLGWAQSDTNAFKRASVVTNKVLIIGGQYDVFIPVSNQLKLYQTLPNSRLILLPDAGHAVLFQYPELFLEEAGYFLKN